MEEHPLARVVHLFTDGGCSGNPGPCGWAYILHDLASGKKQEASGYMPDTTNNQMELQAVIEGLKVLKVSCEVELFTDSVYVGKEFRNGCRVGRVAVGNGRIKIA